MVKAFPIMTSSKLLRVMLKGEEGSDEISRTYIISFHIFYSSCNLYNNVNLCIWFCETEMTVRIGNAQQVLHSPILFGFVER